MAEKIQTLRVTETTAEQLESDFKDELIKVISQYYVAVADRGDYLPD